MQYEITVNDMQVGEPIDDGYILLARKLLKSPTWEALTAEQRTVMITCLLLANHKNGRWWDKYSKQFIEVNRGEFITSRDHLCEACGKGMTQQKLRTSLATLENMKFLTKQPTKHFTKISIDKYSYYQTPANYLTKQPTQDQPKTNPSLTINNNDKNDKNDKKGDIYPADFEIFWANYPRKVDKQTAFKVWNTRIKDKHTADEMINAAKVYTVYCKQNGTITKYMKHAATFLGPDKPFLEFTKGGPPGGQAQNPAGQADGKPKGKYNHLYIHD